MSVYKHKIYTKVTDLIKAEQGTWNEEAIREIAKANQIDAILSITVARTKTPDLKKWHVEGSGVYTARSGYRLLLQGSLDKQNTPRKSNTNLGTNFFPNLWAL